MRIFVFYLFHRNEFIEHPVVNHQHHGRVVEIILQSEETFTGIVSLHVVHFITADNLLVLFAIRGKCHSSMKEHFQIRPYLRQIICALDFHDMSDNSQHPRRHSRQIGHILVHRATRNLFHLFLKVTQQCDFLFGHTNKVDQWIDILNQNGRQVTHQTPLQIIIGSMTTSQNQPFSRKKTAIGILLQIKRDGIHTAGIMDIVQSFLADRNKLALIICRTRRLCKPNNFTRPQHIFFSPAHALHVWLYFLISLQRNTLIILITLYVFIAILQSPFRIGSVFDKTFKDLCLNSFRLSGIQCCSCLSGFE